MDLQHFLDLYAPLNLVSYDRENRVIVAHDADDEPFIIMVKINTNTYVALTNYDDPGIAFNEFYITDTESGSESITYPLFQDYDNKNTEHICVKAIQWAVQVKQALRTTDDYHTIIGSSTHPFLRAIYDQYFCDLDSVVMILTHLIVSCSNYPSL